MGGNLNKNKEENNMNSLSAGEKTDNEKKKELERLRGERKKTQPVKRPKNPKFLKWTLIIMAVLVLFGVVLNLYERWQGERDVERLKNALEEWEEAMFEEKNNDTVGGATPQETLDLFISAVERGDYELASSYFVVGKKEEWRENLVEIAEKKKSDVFLTPIIFTDLNANGEYSENKESFSVHKPIYINFIKYPKGNWKIEEI